MIPPSDYDPETECSCCGSRLIPEKIGFQVKLKWICSNEECLETQRIGAAIEFEMEKRGMNPRSVEEIKQFIEMLSSMRCRA
jgi:hypothetical protein